MPQLLNIGSKQILFKRVVYSILCSVFSQVLFLTTFLTVMNFSVLQPFAWIPLIFATLTSPNTWLFLIPLVVIIFAQGVICSKDYIFDSSYHKNRINQICSIFSMRNAFMMFLHILTGGLIVWLYLGNLGGSYGRLYDKCYSFRYCLVEETFFMVASGFWTGFYYFVKGLTRPKNITFPVIQQNKALTVKINILSKFKQAMHEAVWPTVYFIFIYYYTGNDFKKPLTSFFGLVYEERSLSLFQMFFSSLLIYSWMFATLFIFTMLCMRLFFEVFLTEHWIFPIESDLTNVLLLKNALCINTPIIQHLACLDIHLLSLWDANRRQQLFSLSLPGGHPHHWNQLLAEILKMLTEYSGDLSTSADAILTFSEPLDPAEPEKPEKQQHPPTAMHLNPSMRSLILPNPEPADLVSVLPNEFVPSKFVNFRATISMKLKQNIAMVKRKCGVNYLFGDLPEARMYYLLTKGQPIIWAVQGLSLLVTASFTEDKYGIVQKDLPQIVSVLVGLKQSLEKVNKATILSRKTSTNDIYKLQLKTSLRSAIKRSLYSICNTFGEYLPHFKLDKEVARQLQNFVTYKEG